ncbi:TlpA family protein disulfide reductase [Maribacter aestuarii]|uniref:TlpA family protein disulfide reductase n=1 Tax=Maribacter aestuarii TaxID=1130723 RepID=UPI00248ABE56|nr:TlpA disulfide reductase family protein [Maribacter aestuarii]
MKKIFFLFLIFVMNIGFSQYSISGNLTPTKDFKWLIAYKLTPTGQNYIADTEVSEGYFNLKLPVTAQPGMYRLVYAVPQDEYFIDVIYNKKEDIEFNFDLDQGINFIKSEENLLYTNYLDEINSAQNELLDYYSTGRISQNEFNEITDQLRNVQNRYEAIAPESIAHQFISSNRNYVPESQVPLETLLQNKKSSYFEHLDVDNRILQSSGFLTDKITNYVFSALSPSISTKVELEKAINENIAVVHQKISSTPEEYKLAVFHKLWNMAQDNSLSTVGDLIYENYLKVLALENGNTTIIDEIETTSRLRLGTKSPEITWEKNGKTYSLSDLQGAENYVLVFWSSTCSHCLKEVPQLHKELENFKNVAVLGVGLEVDDIKWKKEVARLPNFEHAIALGKWESDYAKVFAIDKTPTYFILDSEKRFIAQPESDKELIEFLRKKE